MTKTNNKKNYKNANIFDLKQDDSQDLWEIRLQLTQIKSMMK